MLRIGKDDDQPPTEKCFGLAVTVVRSAPSAAATSPIEGGAFTSRQLNRISCPLLRLRC